MTVPIERFRSVNYTREFLRPLLRPNQTPRVPRAIREEAMACLRHFPGQVDMEIAAQQNPELWGNKWT